MKADYKAACGKDWKPGQGGATSKKEEESKVGKADTLDAKITEQGNAVRKLKEAKAAKVLWYISLLSQSKNLDCLSAQGLWLSS